MFVTMQQPNYECAEYVFLNTIDKKDFFEYNIYMMDINKNNSNNNNNNDDDDNDIFVPTKKDMENAKKRYEERKQQRTSKGYNKYLKKLMKSYSDVRINGK